MRACPSYEQPRPPPPPLPSPTGPPEHSTTVGHRARPPGQSFLSRRNNDPMGDFPRLAVVVREIPEKRQWQRGRAGPSCQRKPQPRRWGTGNITRPALCIVPVAALKSGVDDQQGKLTGRRTGRVLFLSAARRGSSACLWHTPEGRLVVDYHTKRIQVLSYFNETSLRVRVHGGVC